MRLDPLARQLATTLGDAPNRREDIRSLTHSVMGRHASPGAGWRGSRTMLANLDWRAPNRLTGPLSGTSSSTMKSSTGSLSRSGPEASSVKTCSLGIFLLILLLLLTQLHSTGCLSGGSSTAPFNSSNQATNSIQPAASSPSYLDQVSNMWKDLTSYSENVINKQKGSRVQSNDAAAPMELLLASGASNASGTIASATQQIVLAGAGPQETDDSSLILSVITANILIFVIGFCGNSLVILVILRFTRIETVTDIYILNLAFADLMFLLGLVFLITTMFIGHWVFGTIMCKLYMASTSLNQFASSLLLVVMSFDRYLAVCHPIYAQRFRRLKRAKIICFCIWIACLVLMTPIFAFAKSNKDLTCAIFWPEYKSFNCEIAFTLYSFAIGFAFPLMLIAAFYICVIRKLRIAASGPISQGSARRSRHRETTNKRIEHLVIGIICTYTICWLPYWITQLCVSFSTTFERSPMEGFYPLVLIATCLSYTNSALNPILYAFLSDNFKRRCSNVFRSIFQAKWCQRGSNCHGPDGHSTIATAFAEHSETINLNNNNLNNNNNNNNNNNSANKLDTSLYPRPESRQTMVMNESTVHLVTRNRQLADIITTSIDVVSLGHNHMGPEHRTDHESILALNGRLQLETERPPPPPPPCDITKAKLVRSCNKGSWVHEMEVVNGAGGRKKSVVFGGASEGAKTKSDLHSEQLFQQQVSDKSRGETTEQLLQLQQHQQHQRQPYHSTTIDYKRHHSSSSSSAHNHRGRDAPV